MTAPLTAPAAGDAARFGGWFVRLGDAVRAGERVAEVLIPGAAIDVLAPADGVLSERCVRHNQALDAGMVLGTLEIQE